MKSVSFTVQPITIIALVHLVCCDIHRDCFCPGFTFSRRLLVKKGDGGGDSLKQALSLILIIVYMFTNSGFLTGFGTFRVTTNSDLPLLTSV